MTATLPARASARAIESQFLSCLPRLAAHARFAFRRAPCPDTRADLIAEAIALAWKQFVSLARRGRKPEGFVSTLALRSTQAVRAAQELEADAAAHAAETRAELLRAAEHEAAGWPEVAAGNGRPKRKCK